MFDETLTSLLNVLNTVECDGNSGFAKDAFADPVVRPDSTKSITEIKTPEIIVEYLYHAVDLERYRTDSRYYLDSTSYIDYPIPVIATYQIDLLTRRKHDLYELAENFNHVIGQAVTLDITWNIGNFIETKKCHMHRDGFPRNMSTHDNEFYGRLVQTYNIWTWNFKNITPYITPLVEERILKNAVGGENDTDINEIINLDEGG